MTPEPLPPQAPPAPGRANGAWREGSWGHSLPHRLWYGLVALGTATLSLTLLQLLLGQRLQQAQTDQIGSEVAFNLRLGELALERYGPRDLSEISGLRLAVAPLPGARPAPRAAAVAGPATDALLRTQAERLRQNLCQRLRPAHCPRVLPASSPPRGVWVEMA
jgi:two-component system, OmpR family, osmolarity sensor histidine kinase EnvZ